MSEVIDQQSQAVFDVLAEKVAKEIAVAQLLIQGVQRSGTSLQALLTEALMLPPCGPQRLQLIQQLMTTAGKLDSACAILGAE